MYSLKSFRPSTRARSLRIAVLGMGHVGLPTAVGFAELGWHVIGADSDVNKIESMKSGECPFYEPGLQDLLRKHLGSGRFELTTRVEDAISAASVLFICVGTPQAEDGRADLRNIEALARTIAGNLNGYKLIVEKSTVPAVTGHWIHRTIERELAALALHSKQAHDGNGDGSRDYDAAKMTEASGSEQESSGNRPVATPTPASNIAQWNKPRFEVASNPEFLQEGKAVTNFFQPDRVVCGVTSERARDILAELYKPLDCPLVFTDLNTAELIKHAANAFLATKISFINLVGDICESVGADVKQVANGIGFDSRIGKQFLEAGIGFGGYCLPKDLSAFIHLAEEHNVQASLLREVGAINSSRAQRLVSKLREALWILQGKTIAVLGLSFKAGTDDIRESPSLKIVEALARHGANLRLYDPKAMNNARQVIPEDPQRIVYCTDAYDAGNGADAVAVLTDWEEFRELDLARFRLVMKVPVLVDARNIFDPEIARHYGYEYVCMGRASDRRRLRGEKSPRASKPVDRTNKRARFTRAVGVVDRTLPTNLRDEPA
ncbi:MAG TPA: UDP-glucose/GDP-mannose dehydrogenase family protein [Clostridia bacterium]|nr:UDP-glucose/GDP-mannose dehydrogenase family protein [Clostridia bacterium]